MKRIIIGIVITLLLINISDISYASLSYSPEKVCNNENLSVQSVFSPIEDEGIEMSFQREAELLMGLRLISSGMSAFGANILLLEKHINSGENKSSIEFLPGIYRDDSGRNTHVRFTVKGHEDKVFEAEYKAVPSAPGVNVAVEGELNAENVFRSGDRVIISRYSPYPKENRPLNNVNLNSPKGEGAIKSSPDKGLQMDIVVPIYREFLNGNVYRFLRSFLEQNASTETFEIIFVVNNSPEEAMNNGPGYMDNQALLDFADYLDNYINGVPYGNISSIPSEYRKLAELIKRKKLKVHFMDMSTSGMYKVIGRIRNVGIFEAIKRFRALGRDGIIASVDADSIFPPDYVKKMLDYYREPGVEAVYPNREWKFNGGSEVQFRSTFVHSIIKKHHTFGGILFKGRGGVDGDRISARSSVWEASRGFSQIDMDEDFEITNRWSDELYNIVYAWDIDVYTQDRTREMGYDAKMRKDDISDHQNRGKDDLFYSFQPVPFLRVEMFMYTLAGLFKYKTFDMDGNMERVKAVFRQYNVPFVEAEVRKMLDDSTSRKRFHDVFLEDYCKSAGHKVIGSPTENLEDFKELIVKSLSGDEYSELHGMIEKAVEKEKREIDVFNAEIRDVIEKTMRIPDIDNNKNMVYELLASSKLPFIADVLSGEEWFVDRLIEAVGENTVNDAYEYLSSYYPDWINKFEDMPARKDLVYFQVLERFLELTVHFPDKFPETHSFISNTHGIDYFTLSGTPVTRDSEQASELYMEQDSLTRKDEAFLYEDSKAGASIFLSAENYITSPYVNIYIDADTIQDGSQFNADIDMLASVIAVYEKQGLHARYLFYNDDKGTALKVLRDSLKRLGTGTNVDFTDMMSVLGVPYTEGSPVNIYFNDLKSLDSKKEINDRDYVVALERTPDKTLKTIPNYISAMTIGISLAVLRAFNDEVAAGRADPGDYERILKKAGDKFRKIFMEYGLISDNKEFSDRDIELVVTGSFLSKLLFARRFSLPPMIRAVESIRRYYDQVRKLLSYA